MAYITKEPVIDYIQSTNPKPIKTKLKVIPKKYMSQYILGLTSYIILIATFIYIALNKNISPDDSTFIVIAALLALIQLCVGAYDMVKYDDLCNLSYINGIVMFLICITSQIMLQQYKSYINNVSILILFVIGISIVSIYAYTKCYKIKTSGYAIWKKIFEEHFKYSYDDVKRYPKLSILLFNEIMFAGKDACDEAISHDNFEALEPLIDIAYKKVFDKMTDEAIESYNRKLHQKKIDDQRLQEKIDKATKIIKEC